MWEKVNLDTLQSSSWLILILEQNKTQQVVLGWQPDSTTDQGDINAEPPPKKAFLPTYTFRHKIESNFTFFRSKPASTQTKPVPIQAKRAEEGAREH